MGGNRINRKNSYFCTIVNIIRMNSTKQLLKQAITAVLSTGLAFLTFASIGDGKGKTKSPRPAKSLFTPIKTNSGFTLKSGLTYRGSMLLMNDKNKKGTSYYNSLVTYQRGNSTFILPYRTKIPVNSKMQMRSNLQSFTLKLNLSGH
jgi:hypothetical protein